MAAKSRNQTTPCKPAVHPLATTSPTPSTAVLNQKISLKKSPVGSVPILSAQGMALAQVPLFVSILLTVITTTSPPKRQPLRITYTASDVQSLWESNLFKTSNNPFSARPLGGALNQIDENAHVAIFKTTRSKGFDPDNDTLLAECLTGNGGISVIVQANTATNTLISTFGFYLYACAYDGDNVFCDRWNQRFGPTPRLQR